MRRRGNKGELRNGQRVEGDEEGRRQMRMGEEEHRGGWEEEGRNVQGRKERSGVLGKWSSL